MSHSDIQYVPISEVQTHPDNPRFIRDDRFRLMVQSLRECPEMFIMRPLICSDRTGNLIVLGGNMRLRAAKELGYSDVPVIIVHGLDEKQEREYMVRDNGHYGEWDYDLLSGWTDLELNDLGADIPDDWLIDDDMSQDEGGDVKDKVPSITIKMNRKQYDRYQKYKNTQGISSDTDIIWALLERVC